jgi:hypothetical protein
MRRIAARVLIAVLLLAAFAPAVRAHVGFEHFVGAVTAIDDRKVEIHTETATVALRLTAETRYLRRGRTVARNEIVTGSRLVVDALRENGVWVAKEVRFVVEVD